MPRFGHEFRQKYYTEQEEDTVLISHGSYGTTPSMVIEEQTKIVKEHEKYPERFVIYTSVEKYKQQVQTLASYLELEDIWKSIVLVTNTSTGINTVLRSYPWKFGTDKILLHSNSFKACKNTVEFLHDYYGLQYEIIPISYPIEDHDVVAKFKEKLQTGEFTMCMFDTVCSIPGVKMPYEELTRLCNKYDVLSLIDAAHGAGLLDLTFIKTCKPTFLVSNLHKWLSVPKSCAMLYVDAKFHKVIQTLPVSSNYRLQPSQPDMLLIEKFARAGTISYASYLCTEKAIEFRSQICGGETAIRKYQQHLRDAAALKVIDCWRGISSDKANLLENSTKSLSPPGIFSIRFPVDKEKYNVVYTKMVSDQSYYSTLNKKYLNMVILKHKTFAPFFVHNKDIYVRFCVQMFNEIDDYVIGAKTIRLALTELFESEFASLASK
ncbi:hypothetical protein ACO0QE_001905 [Hanseniaspora vineae]